MPNWFEERKKQQDMTAKKENFMTMEAGQNTQIRLLQPPTDEDFGIRGRFHWLSDLKLRVPCLGDRLCRTVRFADGANLHDLEDSKRTYRRFIIFDHADRKVKIMEAGGAMLWRHFGEWADQNIGGKSLWGDPGSYEIVISCVKQGGHISKTYVMTPTKEPLPLTEEDKKVIASAMPTMRELIKYPTYTLDQVREMLAEASADAVTATEPAQEEPASLDALFGSEADKMADAPTGQLPPDLL